MYIYKAHNVGDKLAKSEALGWCEAQMNRGWKNVKNVNVLSWLRNEAVEQLLRLSKEREFQIVGL